MRLVVLLLVAVFNGCAVQHAVIEPLRKPAEAPQAVPKYEPRTIAGNKNPYTVLGKSYHVLPTALSYKEQGVASWYGKQFHGRATSNGEKFDMYAVSAAHKTLPIPSYVKVTNLANQKTLMVRVNDRGPFVDDRIIDLSYAAALQLGFADKGITEVLLEAMEFHADGRVMTPAIAKAPMAEAPSVASVNSTNVNTAAKPEPQFVEAIEDNQSDSTAVAVILASSAPKVESVTEETTPERYVQVGRYQSEVGARALAQTLNEHFEEPIIVHRSANDFLVAIGPLMDLLAVDRVKALLGLQGYDGAFTINAIR